MTGVGQSTGRHAIEIQVASIGGGQLTIATSKFAYALHGYFYCANVPTLGVKENIEYFFQVAESESVAAALRSIQGGAFAIAVIDRRKNEVTLACDLYGIVPIFYSVDARSQQTIVNFSFHADEWHDYAGDPDAVEEFLRYGALLFSDSFNIGVSRVPAGSSVVIAFGKPAKATKWASQSRSRPLSKGESIEVVDAAYSRLFSKVRSDDVAVVSLSGGFDSRLIAGYLSERTNQVQALTMGSERTQEVTSAATIASLLGLPHLVRRVPSTLISQKGGEIAREFHLRASLEVAHVFVLRSLVAEASSKPETLYFDGFLGDVVMGGTYFSAPGRTLLEIARDVVFVGASVQPLRSFEYYVADALAAKQGVPIAGDRSARQLESAHERLAVRIAYQLKPLFDQAESHDEMLNLCRLQYRGYRYISNGPISMFSVAPTILPFMDYGVRAALDGVSLSWLRRHQFYREFLRRRFPKLSGVPKAYVGVSAKSSERTFRLMQYLSGFMRHVVFPAVLRASGGRIDLAPEYASVDRYLSDEATVRWLRSVAAERGAAQGVSYEALRAATKLRAISLWLSGFDPPVQRPRE